MPTLGDYTLHAIETGRFALDGGAMFGIVPKPLWSRRIEPDARNRIPLAMRCLLLASSDRVVLVDTGIGDKHDAKFADIFAVDHAHSDLHGSLREAGYSADDVTDVILTHLHFDHAGGATRRQGERLAPTFANARYHVQRRQWDWARDPNPRERGSFLEENMTPLEASGQLVLHDGDGEILPGIEARLVHGHTEAQQLVLVRGASTTLAFAADLLPTSHHLAAAWGMAYDVRPLVTIEEKAAFLDEAQRGGWTLFLEHDPDVALVDLHDGERGIEAAHPRPLDEL